MHAAAAVLLGQLYSCYKFLRVPMPVWFPGRKLTVVSMGFAAQMAVHSNQPTSENKPVQAVCSRLICAKRLLPQCYDANQICNVSCFRRLATCVLTPGHNQLLGFRWLPACFVLWCTSGTATAVARHSICACFLPSFASAQSAESKHFLSCKQYGVQSSELEYVR